MKSVKKSAAKKQTRRVFGPRAPRTYYAMSQDGNTLYRFGVHIERQLAIKEQNLIPLEALDYRNKVREDIRGKLTIVDYTKGHETVAAQHIVEAEVAPAPEPVPTTPAQNQSREVVEALALFRKSIEQLVHAAIPQATEAGEVRYSGSRPVPSH